MFLVLPPDRAAPCTHAIFDSRSCAPAIRATAIGTSTLRHRLECTVHHLPLPLLRTELAEAGASLAALVTRPSHCLPFLRPGRLVRVVSGGTDWGTGVVVAVARRPDAPQPGPDGEVGGGRGGGGTRGSEVRVDLRWAGAQAMASYSPRA